MALTPDQWLDRLTKQMDGPRRARLAKLRSYMDGCAPLPEGAEGCRDAYQAFQKKARTNFGELVTDAVVERMIPSGFTVAGEKQDNDQARAIWTRNQLQIGVADVLRDMVGLSHGYVIVGEDPTARRKAVVTCERPEQVITEQSAARPDQVRAGLKVYRDDADGLDVAYLHLPGSVTTFKRDVSVTGAKLDQASGGWEVFGEPEDTGLDFVPIFPFINRGGLGEFETHIDILDRINWNVLQRLVITAMQAYRQRAIELDEEDLPEEDAEGKEIDYKEMFKPGPGALWKLPKGAKLWESAQTDFTHILSAAKDDITHLAAVTRTPMATLIPGGENQSAEGAAFAKEGLVFKAGDRVERAKATLGLVMGAALAIEKGESRPVDVQSLWHPVERQSLAERADAATKATDLPWRKRMTSIWGYSEDEVDAMEADRAADLLQQAMLTAAAAPAPTAAPKADVRPS